jgi:hypothetical protein
MRKMQVTLAAVFLALATPAFAQSADGHYYKHHYTHHRYARIPEAAIAAVPEATPVPQSSCRIVPAQLNPYCPPDCQWTTACGPY